MKIKYTINDKTAVIVGFHTIYCFALSLYRMGHFSKIEDFACITSKVDKIALNILGIPNDLISND